MFLAWFLSFDTRGLTFAERVQFLGKLGFQDIIMSE